MCSKRPCFVEIQQREYFKSHIPCPACIQAYERCLIFGLLFCSVIAETVTVGLDYEEYDIGFNIGKTLRMALYSQTNRISHPQIKRLIKNNVATSILYFIIIWMTLVIQNRRMSIVCLTQGCLTVFPLFCYRKFVFPTQTWQSS